ncbi:MAG: hypothetical protein LBT85_01095 [Bifidobacteriaceae bacterium]|jgi:hypothetical protein|nr:hypothetical protein [Bifidobacteriaceae bacterium]
MSNFTNLKLKKIKLEKLGTLSIILIFGSICFISNPAVSNASAQSVLSITKGGTNANSMESAQKSLGAVETINGNVSDDKFLSSKAVYDYIDEVISPGEFVVSGSKTMHISNNDLNFKKTWGDTNSPLIRNITFGNKKFVAVGQNGSIIHSNDGINWLNSNTPSEMSSVYITGIAWGQNKFLACTETGKVLTSNDGINFTTATNSVPVYAYNIIYANNKWVLISASQVAISDDGENWTITFSSGNNLRGITYAAGKFIVGGKSQILYSYDAISWSKASTSSPITGIVHGLTYSNILKAYVGIGYDSDQSFLSSDGVNWTVGQLPKSGYWNNVIYKTGKFVAVGSTIAYSYDGTNWTEVTNIDSPSNLYSSIVYVKDSDL